VCVKRGSTEAPRGRGLWVLEHMLIERGRTKPLTFDDYQDGTVSVRPSFLTVVLSRVIRARYTNTTKPNSVVLSREF
jgi:hypothetical protein